jgi:hypothetical protein
LPHRLFHRCLAEAAGPALLVGIGTGTIVAAGEKADISGLPAELDFSFASMGGPVGKREDWMTDVEGGFASGRRSVVYAMAAGTKVAEAIDRFVSKKTGRSPIPRPNPFGGKDPQRLPPGYGGPTWHS